MGKWENANKNSKIDFMGRGKKDEIEQKQGLRQKR
jgi:hypothetical protein